MFRYIVRRILQMIPVLIGTTFIIFCLVFALPGDRPQRELGVQVAAGGHDDAGERRPRAARGPVQVGVLLGVGAHQLAVGGDEGGADDLGGQSPEAESRAVRAGGDGSRDRLPVDVAEVGHREPVGSE